MIRILPTFYRSSLSAMSCRALRTVVEFAPASGKIRGYFTRPLLLPGSIVGRLGFLLPDCHCMRTQSPYYLVSFHYPTRDQLFSDQPLYPSFPLLLHSMYYYNSFYFRLSISYCRSLIFGADPSALTIFLFGPSPFFLKVCIVSTPLFPSLSFFFFLSAVSARSYRRRRCFNLNIR